MAFKEGAYWHYARVMPNGQEFRSRQHYQTINPIDGYVALDAFSDETGAVNPDLPRALVTTIVLYASAEDVQKVIDSQVAAQKRSSGRGPQTGHTLEINS